MVMVMTVIVVIVIVVMQSRVRQNRARHLMSELALEPPLDAGILLSGLDLLNVERNAQALRKISFRNGPVTHLCIARIEVLMEPEVRRRNQRPGLPIDLDRIRLQTVLTRKRKALPVQRKDYGFVRVTMPEFVIADLEL